MQAGERKNTNDAAARRQRWNALWAAMLGYMLDAMDVLLYVFAIQALRSEFGLTNAQAGLVSSATLIASSAGGIAAGVLSDRFGRKRVLIWTVLVYSAASAGTATAVGLGGLLFWRALVGLGLGGEWAAGATLVAESWPGENRGKAIAFMQSGWALGYMLAAIATALILPRFGWRVLFLAGIAPALLTVWIRRSVEEPAVWQSRPRQRRPFSDLFRPPLLRTTVFTTSVATATLFAYWGLFTWLPGFLSAPRSAGGAGFDVIRTSVWVFVLQGGAFAGYVTFGFLADRLGRRPAFLIYVCTAAALVPVYGSIPAWGSDTLLLILGPLIGFFGSGYFSLFGAMLAELYPTELRGAGQGFTYNLGRGLSALAPFAVGAIADARGFGWALALNSGFFLLAAGLILLLPETRRHSSLAVSP